MIINSFQGPILPNYSFNWSKIRLERLYHAVSNGFNNLPFLLRATDKLQTLKTHILCMSSFIAYMLLFCFLFSVSNHKNITRMMLMTVKQWKKNWISMRVVKPEFKSRQLQLWSWLWHDKMKLFQIFILSHNVAWCFCFSDLHILL